MRVSKYDDAEGEGPLAQLEQKHGGGELKHACEVTPRGEDGRAEGSKRVLDEDDAQRVTGRADEATTGEQGKRPRKQRVVTSAMDDAGGEDPFERLNEELEQA